MTTDGDKPDNPQQPGDDKKHDESGQIPDGHEDTLLPFEEDPLDDALDVGDSFTQKDAPEGADPFSDSPSDDEDPLGLGSTDDSFGGSPFSADSDDEPGMDATEDELSGLTEMDLSMIGSYRSTIAPDSFSSDDVFGDAAPPSETEAPKEAEKEAEKEDIPEDFFKATPPKASSTDTKGGLFDGLDNAVDDPFASLGDIGGKEVETPFMSSESSDNAGAQENTEFFDFLGDEQAAESIDSLFDGDEMPPADDGADPFADPGDGDTFFVDAAGDGAAAPDFFGDSFDLETTEDFPVEGDTRKTRRLGGGELQRTVSAPVGRGMRTIFISVGAIILVGAGLGLFTDMGYFGMEFFFPKAEPDPWEPVTAQGGNFASLKDIAPTYSTDIRKLEAAVLQAPQDKTGVQMLLSKYLQFHARFPLHAAIFVKGSEQPGSLIPDLGQLMAQVGMKEHPDLQGLDLMRRGEYAKAAVKLGDASQELASGGTTVLTSTQIAFFTALAHYRDNTNPNGARAEFETGCKQHPKSSAFCYFAGQALSDHAMSTKDYQTRKTLMRTAQTKFETIVKATDGMHLPSIFAKAKILIKEGAYSGASAPFDKTTGKTGLLFQALLMAQQMGSKGDIYLAHSGIAHARYTKAQDPMNEETKSDPIKKKVFLDQRTELLEQYLEHQQKAFQANARDSDILMALIEHYEKKGHQSKVIELLNSALLGGCTAPPFYDRIIHSILPFNLALAEQYSKMATANNPGNVDMLLLQAKVFTEKKDWESAQRKFRQAIKAEPTRSDGYIQLAQLLRSRGKMTQAINKLVEGQKRNEKSADLLLALGEFYAHTSRYEDSKKEFEKALAIEPDNIEIRTAYALVLSQMGLAKNAVREFETLLKSNQGNSDLIIQYVHALTENNRTLEAIAQLQHILNSDPQHVDANIEMAILCLERGDFTGANQYIEQALRTSPGRHAAIYQKGRLAEAQGNKKDAIRFYRKTLESPEDNIEYRFALAKALSGSRETRKEAEGLLDHILNRYQRPNSAGENKQDPEIYLLRGSLWQSAGKLENALRNYQAALVLEPTLKTAKEREARVLFDMSRYNESERRFQEILTQDKSNTQANFILGQIAHSRGEIKKAEGLYLAASTTAGLEFAEVNKTLGLLYREQRDAFKSKKYLQRYLAMGSPSSEERDEVQRIIHNLRH